MKSEPRKRGRPRNYDPDEALGNARDVFWDAGYASSSLDELSSAMSMNRPSLYGAFGDKEALYLRTLERYRQDGLAALLDALAPDRPLRECIAAVYVKALDIYMGGPAPRGCFLIGTATSEAIRHDAIRQALLGSLLDFDHAIEARMRLAVERGELKPECDAAALAKVASSVMYALAVRARAGESRSALEAIAETGTHLICGNVDGTPATSQ